MATFRNAQGNVVTDVAVTPIITSGTHIATINGTKVYAPNNGGGGGGGSSQRLAGKRYITIGDSITYRNQYQEIVDSILGTTHTNYGVSGATFSRFPWHNADVQPNPEGDTETTGWDRYLNSEDLVSADFLIICGYANSLWDRLGSMSDTYITINDNTTYSQLINQSFYAQAKSVLEFFSKIFNNRPILVCGQLPMSRRSDSWNTGDATVDFKRTYKGGATTRAMSDALKEVADYLAIPYVDLERNGGVNINNYTTYYSGTDTTHPNFRAKVRNDYPESGMRRMAVAIADAINKII